MNDGKEIDSFDNAMNITETTKIIALNTDCLELIFEHLEFFDLINISDTNKHFYCAACQVYKRKHQNTNPIFDKDILSRYFPICTVFTNNDESFVFYF